MEDYINGIYEEIIPDFYNEEYFNCAFELKYCPYNDTLTINIEEKDIKYSPEIDFESLFNSYLNENVVEILHTIGFKQIDIVGFDYSKTFINKKRFLYQNNNKYINIFRKYHTQEEHIKNIIISTIQEHEPENFMYIKNDIVLTFDSHDKSMEIYINNHNLIFNYEPSHEIRYELFERLGFLYIYWNFLDCTQHYSEGIIDYCDKEICLGKRKGKNIIQKKYL